MLDDLGRLLHEHENNEIVFFMKFVSENMERKDFPCENCLQFGSHDADCVLAPKEPTSESGSLEQARASNSGSSNAAAKPDADAMRKRTEAAIAAALATADAEAKSCKKQKNKEKRKRWKQ